MLTLVAILMLGGPTLQKFVAIMIVGLVSGTYSSIFNAAALLVAWEEGSFFGKKKSANGGALPPAKPAAA
jgi:preprotein translocase subunit SecF